MNLYKMPNTANGIVLNEKLQCIFSNGVYLINEDSIKPVFTVPARHFPSSWLEINGEVVFSVVDTKNENYPVVNVISIDGESVPFSDENVEIKYAGCRVVEGEHRETIYVSDSSGKKFTISKEINVKESDNRIYVRSNRCKKLTCLNSDAELVWEHDFNIKNHHSTKGALLDPCITSEACVFFLGTQSDQNHVLALDKKDGSTLWQYSTSTLITSISSYKETICLVDNGKLIQIDANTGETISKTDSESEPHKFQAFIRDNKYLYFTCHITHQIRVFDSEATQLLHIIDIPEPYTTSRLQLPIVCEDKGLYVELAGREMYQMSTVFGVLHIGHKEIAGSDSITLAGEKEPYCEINCVLDENGENLYLVYLEDADMDLIERYTEVKIAELAGIYANQAYPSDTVDEKFGGKIQVKVKKGLIKTPDSDRLDESIKRLEWLLVNFWPGAKNGKKNLELSWSWV